MKPESNPPSKWNDHVHVDPDEGRQQIALWFGRVEDNDPPAGFERTILLFQRLLDVAHVAHQEAGDDCIEDLIAKREI